MLAVSFSELLCMSAWAQGLKHLYVHEAYCIVRDVVTFHKLCPSFFRGIGIVDSSTARDFPVPKMILHTCSGVG